MPSSVAAESLNLGANQWKFLERVDDYIVASERAHQPRTLARESTRRQFATAAEILTRLTGSGGAEVRQGVLLADDVGLGKTTVAALVAWIVARAGDGRQVRILAPNDVMVRRWSEELESHVAPLAATAKHLEARASHIRVGDVRSLKRGSIHVAKHSYASQRNLLACDLLIVDEAHRAKGENSDFATELEAQRKHARRTLILTATPFSIQLEEFSRMLSLVGASNVKTPLRAFSRARDRLYGTDTAQSADILAGRLVESATQAVAAIAPYVIRHGVDQLLTEQQAFGSIEDWCIEVPAATDDELSLMLRLDRVLRLLPKDAAKRTRQSNDARFHVGWRHLDSVVDHVESLNATLPPVIQAVVTRHLEQVRVLRHRAGVHSKMRAVGDAVREVVIAGEKVVLFCHHHATAQELALHLSDVIPSHPRPLASGRDVWRTAWNTVLSSSETKFGDGVKHAALVRWLGADAQVAQVTSWLQKYPRDGQELAMFLEQQPARNSANTVSVAQAARLLYEQLCKSSSGSAVLRNYEARLNSLPGGAKSTRVFATCAPIDSPGFAHLFLQNQHPDTVMAIFNSPFGPDALVVTDRLSEGVDLHRYCRHLVHYELDPSPMRTVQRNGRLRRVNSWASIVHEPIRYAYPAFRGTRDQRLVEIMQKRLNSFSLLLGGVHSFDVDTDTEEDERWRERVLTGARRQMLTVGAQLCCASVLDG